PVEPCGNSEIALLYGNPSSRNAISRAEVPRPANLPGDVAGAPHRPVVPASAPVLHSSVLSQCLHVVRQDERRRRWHELHPYGGSVPHGLARIVVHAIPVRGREKNAVVHLPVCPPLGD